MVLNGILFFLIAVFLTRISRTIQCHKSSGSKVSRTSLVECELRTRSVLKTVLELSCVLHIVC